MLDARLLALPLLLVSLLASAQETSFGILGGVEFAHRTIRAEEEGQDAVVDAVSDATEFVLRPAIGIEFERQLNSLFSVALQLRYQSAGYEYVDAEARFDPLAGEETTFLSTASNFRYDYIALPIGAAEQWGQGAYRFYAEEYLVPMLNISSQRSIDWDPDLTATIEVPGSVDVERVQDFQLGVRVGFGVQRTWNDILRVRLGLSGHYNFTLTQDDSFFREHLYGFGPQLSIARVWGYVEGQKTGDDIYY